MCLIMCGYGWAHECAHVCACVLLFIVTDNELCSDSTPEEEDLFIVLV